MEFLGSVHSEYELLGVRLSLCVQSNTRLVCTETILNKTGFKIQLGRCDIWFGVRSAQFILWIIYRGYLKIFHWKLAYIYLQSPTVVCKTGPRRSGGWSWEDRDHVMTPALIFSPRTVGQRHGVLCRHLDSPPTTLGPVGWYLSSEALRRFLESRVRPRGGSGSESSQLEAAAAPTQIQQAAHAQPLDERQQFCTFENYNSDIEKLNIDSHQNIPAPWIHVPLFH